jgi:DNA-binding GntR family transcriptional regulator
MQTSFYPQHLVERGANRLQAPVDVAEGTVRYLRETLGIEQVGYVDRLQVRPVNQEEEKFFELWAGSQRSVLENKRIAYDKTGSPFRLTVTVFHPDRTEIAIYEGEVPDTAQDAHQTPS